MRSLIILVATTAVVCGHREMTPGYDVEFRPFGGSPVYQEQRLPSREQSRSFRESLQPSEQQQLQSFREETFREYRPPFHGREETRIFHDETRGAFKGDIRIFKEENRESFKDELRNFSEESRPFRDESRIFKDEVRSFRDESGRFREERPFTDSRPFRDGPRHFKDERPFKDERRQYKDEFRPYRDEYRPIRDESRTFRDDFRHFEGPRNFRDEHRPLRNEASPFRDSNRPFTEESLKSGLRAFKEESGQFRNEPRPFKEESGPYRNEPRPFKEELGPFRNEPRPFKEESGQFRNEPRPFKEESGPFRNEPRPLKEESGPFRNEPRPFKEESGQFRNEAGSFKEELGPFRNELRPFKDESGPFRNEPRPFKGDSQSFKDEILFTQESQSLAEAQHRYNKEQEHRQPLSFGGHSNYLKFGNHGLGFASVPAAILPLEDSSHQSVSQTMRSELSQTAATQSPGTSSSQHILDTKNQISVTAAPDIGSTPSQSASGNTIDSNTVNGERKNEKLAGEVSTSQPSTAVTISTSGGTNVTPKVVFSSGSTSMSSPPLGITNVDSASGIQQATHTASALHASKPSSMHAVASTNSYFPSDTTPEVPAALLNYIFKYQMPQEDKMRYVYRQSLPSESFNHIQPVPLVHHHQTAFLPEFKIPSLSGGIHQPGGTINYVSTTDLPKVSYLNGNSPGLSLGTTYSTDSVQPVNFARNLLHLNQGGQFSHLGQTDLSQFRSVEQAQQFPQLRQLSSSTNLNSLGQYGQFGQNDQSRGNPFNQGGGLQLQLGGFGGIDYSALSSNTDASRASPVVSLGISKVGLSFPESARPPAPAFTKVSFGESLW